MNLDFYKKETLIRQKFPIPASYLKYIAIITMLIDHIGAALLEREVWFFYEKYNMFDSIYTIDMILRSIGRIAFPLFAFMIAEGAIHTKNIQKYALRLVIFGIVSEVPFDWAFFDSPFYIENNNVFFTLAIAVCTFMCIDKLKDVQFKYMLSDQQIAGGELVIFALGAILAQVLRTDYGACGVIVIYVIYKSIQMGKKEIGFIISIVILVIMCGEIEKWAIFGLLPVYLYNGKRGKQNKYFFYIFYPGHLVMLAVLRNIIFR